MSKKHGFTLVELLVVIGIIALLISILLPSLARARQSAVTIHCLSNVRSIGQALLLYADSNRGFFPHGWANNGPGHDLYWYSTLASFMNGASLNPWDSTAAAQMSLFKCGALTGERAFPWTPGSQMGGHPIVFGTFFWPSPAIPANSGQIPLYKASWLARNGSEKAIVWDASIEVRMDDAWGGACFPGSGNVDGDRFWWGSYLIDAPGLWPTWHNINDPISLNGVFQEKPNNRADGGTGDFFSVRHNGGTACNFLFGDGHAETHTFRRNGQSLDQGGSSLTHANFAVPVGYEVRAP